MQEVQQQIYRAVLRAQPSGGRDAGGPRLSDQPEPEETPKATAKSATSRKHNALLAFVSRSATTEYVRSPEDAGKVRFGQLGCVIVTES